MWSCDRLEGTVATKRKGRSMAAVLLTAMAVFVPATRANAIPDVLPEESGVPEEIQGVDTGSTGKSEAGKVPWPNTEDAVVPLVIDTSETADSTSRRNKLAELLRWSAPA